MFLTQVIRLNAIYFMVFIIICFLFFFSRTEILAKPQGNDSFDLIEFLNGSNNLNCTGAVTINTGSSYSGTTVGGFSDVIYYDGIVWMESGPERVHILQVNGYGTLTATLSNLTVDLDVFLLHTCNQNNVMSFADMVLLYPGITPGNYYLVVDGFGGVSGPYLVVTTLSETIPNDLFLQNYTIFAGQVVCYNAIQSIKTAVSSTIYYVQNGAEASFIAGSRIIFYPGTKFYSGSHVHARLAPGGPYCAPTKSTIDSLNNGNNEFLTEISAVDRVFKVFPNPTSGSLTLEFYGNPSGYHSIEIFDFLGRRLIQQNINQGEIKKTISLSGRPTGIYVVRDISSEGIRLKKVILQ
jgi:hypothetical protein